MIKYDDGFDDLRNVTDYIGQHVAGHNSITLDGHFSADELIKIAERLDDIPMTCSRLVDLGFAERRVDEGILFQMGEITLEQIIKDTVPIRWRLWIWNQEMERIPKTMRQVKALIFGLGIDNENKKD